MTLANGTATVSAQVTDAYGNQSVLASQTVTVAETLPTCAINPIDGNDVINNAEAHAAGGVALAGTVTGLTQGATFLVSVTDGAFAKTYTATVGSGGSWSATIPSSDAVTLANGTATVSAQVTDQYGNTANATPQTVTVDEITPAGGTPALTAASDSGASSTDNITNVTNPTFTVALSPTVAVGDTVQLLLNGLALANNVMHTVTAGDVSAGLVSLSVTAGDLGADGTKSITAKFSDAAGNTSTTAADVITLDTLAPTVTISGVPYIFNVNLTVGTGTVTGWIQTDGRLGTLSKADITNSSVVLTDGSHTTTITGAQPFNVSGTDLTETANGIFFNFAGQNGTVGTSTLGFEDTTGGISGHPSTISLNIPGDPSSPMWAAESGNVEIAQASVTNQATQTISGTVSSTEATPGATIYLYDNGSTTAIGSATVGSGGAWSTSVTLSGSGTHSIVAKNTDIAGNTGTSFPVTFNLTIVNGGWGNQTGGSWSDAANWSSGSVPGPTSNVTFNSIGATAPYVVSILPGTTVALNSITLDDPNLMLLDEATLTIAASLTETAGIFEIANGGSASIGGGSSLLVDFVGSGGNLILGSSPGFTGTVQAVSAATGPVTISGSGNVTTTSGDAIDVAAAGGTLASPSILNVSPTGTISGAVNGILVVQSGIGDIDFHTSAPVTGASGDGILAEVSAVGSGNISVIATGLVSGSGAGMNGVLAENLDSSSSGNITVAATGGSIGNEYGIEALSYGSGNLSIEAGGVITSQAQYGIRAKTYGPGNVSIVTDPGSMINSAGAGINASNWDTAIAASLGATVNVTADGSIFFGSVLNLNGSSPTGIAAGFYGANGTTNTAINGTVIVNNYANITQTSGTIGYGIDAYDYGNGNVTVNDETGTTIYAAQYGILASPGSGGTGSLAVNVGANDTIVARSSYGIQASNSDIGTISTQTSGGDLIISGSTGINAVETATALPPSANSTVSVVAYGTVRSGTFLTNSGSQPNGIAAGFFGNGTINNAINGTVSLDNFANVTAAAGRGLDGYTYGNGAITVTDESGTSVSVAQIGIGAYSNGTGGPANAVASAATSTSSSVLTFAATPLWILPGMTVFDVSTGKNIGTVSSTTSSTVTLTANAANPVASGNLLSFPTIAIAKDATSTSSATLDFTTTTPSWLTGGMTVYDVTTGQSVGTISSTTTTTANLAANASSVVNSGDTLSFGDLTVNILANATISTGSLYGLWGIQANTNNGSNMVVTTSPGDVINSAGFGIDALSNATGVSSASRILVTAYGSINSGFDIGTGGGSPAGIRAAYNSTVAVAGSVSVDDFAIVNATAAYGVDAFNNGSGNVSLILEAPSVTNAPLQAVSVFAQGGGNVTVVSKGAINSTTGTGIAVGSGLSNAGNGIISVSNTGTVQSLGASINAGSITGVLQINNATTKASTVTNSGLIASSLYKAASPLNWAISSYYGGNSANNGAVSVTNSGVISGNVFLNTASSAASSFQNQASGIWNILGQNFFNGTGTISNAGTINMAGPSQIGTGGLLSITNNGFFEIASVAVASIAGSVSGTGRFDIGAQASLEFLGSVGAGQTVSFNGEQGLLILDQPSTFSAAITGTVAGDIIEAGSGFTPPAGFSQLSGNLWLSVPASTPTTLTGSLGAQSLNPATAPFVQVSSATITSSTAIGLNIVTTDSNPANTLFVDINQPSLINVTGAFAGVNLTTAGADIAFYNAGNIASTGGAGVSASSGAGSIAIDDFGNISAPTGIRAVAGGTAYTSAATATSSPTLTFSATPGWIAPGLVVFDETTGKRIGVVQSTTGTTVVLAANAASAVGSGDTLSFGAPTLVTSAATSTSGNILSLASLPSWVVPGTAVYDQTTGAVVGTVASTTATTATLTQNAANAVGAGDTLVFTGPISINVGESATLNGPSATAAASTSTSSSTLSLTLASPWVAAGMSVFDMATRQLVGTVSTISGATVTLTGNATNPVAGGDTLSFLSAGSQGIVALTSSGSASVSTAPAANIVAGGNGINVQNQGKLVAPSTLTVEASGTIFSGLVSGSEPAAIQAAYLGGTNFPSSIPNPPLSGIFGDVIVDSSAAITAYSGSGINAVNYGTGNISVTHSGSIIATAAGNTNGTANPTTGLYNPTTAQVGINIVNAGIGDITLVTSGAITSGSTGIYASNAAIGSQTAPLGTSGTPIKVTVVANGAIASGLYLPNGGNAPGGVLANIDPGNINGYNGFVTGDLLVSASGSSIVAQAGDGIRAINHGQGDVTVDLGNNETITALNTPAGASANLAPYGIAINTYGPGNITVATSTGDVITSGSSGINATQMATAIPASVGDVVAINAAGTINAGNVANNSGGTPAAINAGFFNGGAALPNVTGSVIINSTATIIAGARGISGYNYGNGDVTVNDSGSLTVTGDNIRANSVTTTTTQVSEYGIEAATWAGGTGNVAVNVYSGAISATATPTGSVTAATPTSSATLSFAATPTGIAAGMTAYDVTTGRAAGTVLSSTGTTVTLTGNAVTPVANGDMLSFTASVTGSVAATTPTSSPTLSFASTPAGISVGMTVYDLTTGQAVGTVSSVTATTVTLGANATATVTSGDTLSFFTPITSQVYAIFAENNDSGDTSVITNSGSSIYSSGVGIDATNEASPISVATLTAATAAATATTSNTLSFAAAPTWVTLGDPVYDVTSGKAVGTVSSTSATTITLTGNAANSVSQGDVLSFAQTANTSAATPTSSNTLTFGSTPAWIVPGMAVYDVTTGKTIGAVLSTTGTTITLAANATSPVGSGDALSFPEIATAAAATSTSSQTLSFAVAPSWAVTGMTVYDDTTGTSVGTVLSTTANTVKLAVNASSPVASGDVLSFVSSSIVVTSNSTITSGAVLTGTGTPPAGILAGYLGGDTIPAASPVIGADGDVAVNNFGNITANAGDGIRAFTYGIGNVTVSDSAGTITALGGSAPKNGFGDGIDARNWGPGSISVTTAGGTVINSGSSGISAVNYCAPSANSSYGVPATSQITVIASGTISSGSIPTLSGDTSAGILAGYDPGSSLTPLNDRVAGNVLVQDYASITAAAGTDGIRAFNGGTGSVTVFTETGAAITGGRYGIAGLTYDGGNVSIINYASVSGATAAIDAQATGGGLVSIDNYGTINGTVISDASTSFRNEAGAAFNASSSSTFGGVVFSNLGSINVTNGALLTISAASYVDTGALVANGGNVKVTVAEIGAGNATISGTSQIEYDGASNENVTFATGATGELLLLNSSAFTGTITGFTGTGPAPATSDKLDLADINHASPLFSATYLNNVLTVTDGTHTAHINFAGSYTLASFAFATDGANGTLITDPPAEVSGISAGTSMAVGNGEFVELTGASMDAINFVGPTGSLVLDQPESFQGRIGGMTAAGDIIELKGFDAAHTTAIASFDPLSQTTALAITDASDSHVAQLILNGDYSSFAFDVMADPAGGADVALAPAKAIVSSGSSLDLSAPSSETVTFAGGTGQLIVEQPSGFTGHIEGFTGTAPDAAHSDVIDVVGIDFLSANFEEKYDQSSGILSVSDGKQNASFAFVDFKGVFTFTSDGHGGTLIMDPPITGALPTPDQFIFKDPVSSLGHEVNNGARPGDQSEIGNLFKGNGAAADIWVAESDTAFEKSLILIAGSDTEHPNTHPVPIEKVAIAHFHAYDFVFPNH